MKISYDGTTIRFKTTPEDLFQSEKSGAKSNTVRILDYREYQQLKKSNPKKIIIQYQQEIFLRTITNIYATKDVFGKVIVVFSWTNEKHHHPLPADIPRDSRAHTMSLNDDQSVGDDTEEIHTHTMSDYKPGEPPLPRPHSAPIQSGPHNVSPECLTSLDERSPVLLPKTLIHNLGRHRQNKSHAEFIQDLLETYLDKQAYERGPLHD